MEGGRESESFKKRKKLNTKQKDRTKKEVKEIGPCSSSSSNASERMGHFPDLG